MILLLLLLIPATSSLTCTPGQFLSGGQCHRCLLGYRCPDGIQNITCSPGTYTDLYGQTICRICRTGSYAIQNGSQKCMKCPLGFSCADRTQLPVPCPPGSYADLYGQTKCRSCRNGTYTIQSGSTYCTKCPMGNFCATVSKLPVPCAITYYNGLYDQTTCRKCKVNSTTIAVGQNACTPPLASSCRNVCTLVC